MSKKAKIKKLEAEMDKEIIHNRAYNAYLEAQVDELQESLGECQAGRAELQRQIDTDGSKLIAAIWREHAKETAVYADELRAELDEVKEERDYLKRMCELMARLKI